MCDTKRRYPPWTAFLPWWSFARGRSKPSSFDFTQLGLGLTLPRGLWEEKERLKSSAHPRSTPELSKELHDIYTTLLNFHDTHLSLPLPQHFSYHFSNNTAAELTSVAAASTTCLFEFG